MPALPARTHAHPFRSSLRHEFLTGVPCAGRGRGFRTSTYRNEIKSFVISKGDGRSVTDLCAKFMRTQVPKSACVHCVTVYFDLLQ